VGQASEIQVLTREVLMLTKRKECEARPFPTGNKIEIAVVR